MKYTREILHGRHRLSHQQIDSWLRENRSKEFMSDKIERLTAVKHFLSITDLFRQAGVSFISFKGPLLSYRIYGDATIRLAHDIDLMVEIVDVEKAKNILIEHGYYLMDGSFWPQKKVQQDLLINVGYHLSFYNKTLGFCVEIHWILMHELPFSFKTQKKIIAENLTEMDYAGRKFTVFNEEFELLYLIIHGSHHGWSRLKWLLDIYNYPLADLDITKFKKLVKQLHARRIIGQTNYFLNMFFETQLPVDGDKQIPSYFIRFAQQSIDGKVEIELSTHSIISLYRYHWLMFPVVSSKFKMIFATLFRPGDLTVIDSSYKLVYFFYRPYSFMKRRILHN